MGKYGYELKSTSWGNFQKVKNKRIFTILAKRYKELYPDFIKFSLYGHDTRWIGDLQLEEIVAEFWEHRKYLESLSYSFTKELDGIDKVLYNNQIEFKDIFINKDGDTTQLPIILRLKIQGLISVDTLVILDNLINWVDKIETSNPLWESEKKKLKKYQPFLSVNKITIKKIFIKHMKDN